MNIVDRFDKFYSKLRHKCRNPFLCKIKFYSLLRYSTRIFMNCLLPIYFYVTKNRVHHCLKTDGSQRHKRIIVSFTSFPQRIDKVWLTVETILRQNIKPDLLILWLSKEQFSSLDCVPQVLLKQQERGLTIRLVDGDIRSHKKYYYAFTEFPNDIIVTIDDDLYYPSNLIESLLAAHEKDSTSIFARYGYEIQWDDKGTLLSYSKWQKVKNETRPSFSNFFGSGGGTLFPPGALDEDVFNITLSQKLCPFADDVYLNAMAQLKKTRIGIINNSFVLLNVYVPHDTCLATINLGDNRNDSQIDSICKYYINNRTVTIFKKENGKSK